MALNKKLNPQREALIRRAAADVRRLNPHIGAAQQPLSEAEYAEIERGRLELERIWDDMERQQDSKPLTDEPAASAVDEDRGE
jgi:DNA-nicking Smr family endonuclease